MSPLPSLSPRLHFACQLYRQQSEKDASRLLETLERNLELQAVTGATVFLDGCPAPWQRPVVSQGLEPLRGIRLGGAGCEHLYAAALVSQRGRGGGSRRG